MKLKKTIASISLIALIMQTIIIIVPEGVLAVENTREKAEQKSQEVEIGREYEIKEEETWDVSTKQDGSVMAKWTLKDRTLVISGNGEMKDWDFNSSIDWHNNQYTNIIEKVIIEKGVTRIGGSAFDWCRGLKNVEIPESVTSIGGNIFKGCTSLTNINVDINNKKYISEKGILFSEGKTGIVCYPAGKKDLREYIIPESVTSIGYNAFEGCSSLTNIKIPEGVTRIGESTFRECSSLTNIEIPEGLTWIGNYAFSGCSNLTNIKIPEGVAYIGAGAFEKCRSLRNIEIPEVVTSIESWAFSGCSSLTNIKIPEGVTNIGSSAFSGCSSLTNIIIPEGVTVVFGGTFASCSSLSNVVIPEGVTIIGSRAFSYCSNLTNIEIPKGVTSIGEEAFYDCSKLTNIEIPEGVTNILERAFSSNTILNVKADSKAHEYAEKNRKGYILKGRPIVIKTDYEIKEQEEWDVSKKQDGSVIAKWTLEDRTLVILGNGKMRDWESYWYDKNIDWHTNRYTRIIKNVIIEKGVTSIGDYAFNECCSLGNITIPEGVTSIGDYAFKGCNSLTDMKLPQGIIGIEEGTFSGCSSLTNMEISEKITNIGDYALSGCSSLEKITIPEGVTSIGDYAFSKCSSLKEIKVDSRNKNYMSEAGILFNKEGSVFIKYPEGKQDIKEYNISEGIRSIEDGAFSRCSLTNIEIPETITSIGNSVFYRCSNLINIEIPEGVKNIGDSVFEGCSGLTNITIPEGVTSIGENAFNGCSSLTNIEIPEGVKNIGDSTFEGCGGLTNITIPKEVTSIGENAFNGCSSLTNITIPERVTSIGYGAFRGCSSLAEIIIPEGVTSIGWYAFERCSSLESIKIPEKVISIGNSAFEGCSSLANIEILEGVTSIGDKAFSGVRNIIVKKNTVPHRYAEEKKIGYLIDEEGPEITYTPSGEKKPRKQYQIQIKVEDIKTEVNESSLRYQWTQSIETPNKESFKEILKNGQTITKNNGNGIWYLWVYAEDKLGNVTIKRSEGYNFDNTVPNIEVKYSTIKPTSENVRVTIVANEEIQGIEGWEILENEKELTKEYVENIEETVIIKDISGNQIDGKIVIKNIDKVPPKLEIKYSTKNPTRENVTVAITSNEEIQEVEGWKMSENKKEITKEYAENTEETIILKDKVGNQTEVKISIKNIDSTLPEIQIGDINGDKRIDVTDLLLLKRHIIAGNKEEWKLTGEKLQAGDINEDGEVNITDMLLLKREIIGKV